MAPKAVHSLLSTLLAVKHVDTSSMRVSAATKENETKPAVRRKQELTGVKILLIFYSGVLVKNTHPSTLLWFYDRIESDDSMGFAVTLLFYGLYYGVM